MHDPAANPATTVVIPRILRRNALPMGKRVATATRPATSLTYANRLPGKIERQRCQAQNLSHQDLSENMCVY